MDYISTRDSGHRVSAAQAIVSGLSPDGGLFCPKACRSSPFRRSRRWPRPATPAAPWPCSPAS